jgi:glucose/arabinose dehydrogenase
MTTRKRSTLIAALAAVSMLGASFAAATPVAAGTPHVRFDTVISGLNAARGITFDGQGNMYVSESGKAGAGPAGLTHTGKVSKFARGSNTSSWSTSFESLYVTEDPSQPPDVLGPEGISALGNSCSAKGKHEHDGDDQNSCQIRLITSESHDGIAAATGGAVSTTQAGHLFTLNGRTGKATSLSDVGDQQYQWTGDHQALFPSDFPDSNPYGVLVIKDKKTHKIRTFVADAGANTILEVMRDGTTRVIAYIPNETAVPFRDATPTCIAQGPDGMLYVGTLNFVANLFVYGSGKSDVWRVDPNANFPTTPTLWASGLTTVTACTFDRSGNFWAAEMFQPNAGAAAPGDIVRIPFKHPTQLHRIGGGKLALPGGIAQGPDGAMYVTTNSSSPAPGAVVKVQTRSHDDD